MGKTFKMKGGQSAHGYVKSEYGTLNTQLQNASSGNQIQNLKHPTTSQSMIGQSGGRRRRHKKCSSSSSKRTKKGGFWGSVINNAIVPFGLWGLQHKYAKRHGKTRKHSK